MVVLAYGFFLLVGVNDPLYQLLLKTDGKEAWLDVASQEIFPDGIYDDFLSSVGQFLWCMSAFYAFLHQFVDRVDVAIAKSAIDDLVAYTSWLMKTDEQLAVHLCAEAMCLLA